MDKSWRDAGRQSSARGRLPRPPGLSDDSAEIWHEYCCRHRELWTRPHRGSDVQNRNLAAEASGCPLLGAG